MVYMAPSPSVLILEILAHMPKLPRNSMVATFSIPSTVSIQTIDSESMFWGWDNNFGITRKIGDEWAKKQEACILSVPSIVICTERNYILNPLHKDFSKLNFRYAQGFYVSKNFFED